MRWTDYIGFHNWDSSILTLQGIGSVGSPGAAGGRIGDTVSGMESTVVLSESNDGRRVPRPGTRGLGCAFQQPVGAIQGQRRRTPASRFSATRTGGGSSPSGMPLRFRSRQTGLLPGKTPRNVMRILRPRPESKSRRGSSDRSLARSSRYRKAAGSKRNWRVSPPQRPWTTRSHPFVRTPGLGFKKKGTPPLRRRRRWRRLPSESDRPPVRSRYQNSGQRPPRQQNGGTPELVQFVK